jgi:hypothetical protein
LRERKTGFHECLLSDVLGIGEAARHSAAYRDDRPPITPNEHLERTRIPFDRLGHEDVIDLIARDRRKESVAIPGAHVLIACSFLKMSLQSEGIKPRQRRGRY